MELLTEELRRRLPPLRATEGEDDPLVVCKFFHARSGWTWYATEFDGEDTFFGLVIGYVPELGYFSLSELAEFCDSWGLGVERELGFSPTRLSQIDEELAVAQEAAASGTTQRGLPQGVMEAERKEVSPDDKFGFECKRCGRCCFKCEIVLTPYDVLRLCQALGMSTGEFLHWYGRITLGPDSGLPVCSLDFEKAYAWPVDGEHPAPCPFLTIEGPRLACAVYASRPGCCRCYPLFRMGEEIDQLKLHLQQVSCPAGETDSEHTVSEWIEREGSAPYHRENQVFLAQAMTLVRAGHQWPPELLEILAALWFDYSRFNKGESLARKFALAMQGAELLIDAMIKLYRGKEEEGASGSD